MLEPYAMKVARTVLRGGNFSNKTTYLNRPLIKNQTFLSFSLWIIYRKEKTKGEVGGGLCLLPLSTLI